jgi:membrane-anchored glycerophosphoryl diester phosphodiesterase (GDPDase)
MLTGFHCFFYSLTAIQSKITKKVNIIILFRTMDTESIEDQPRKSNKSPM